MVRIDQHGPEGKALQNAVKSKLRDYLGADYSDEASRFVTFRNIRLTSAACDMRLTSAAACDVSHIAPYSGFWCRCFRFTLWS